MTASRATDIETATTGAPAARALMLCVHQGHELYGSDRSFADAVRSFATQADADFEVLLPRRGPIESLFADFSGTVRFTDLFVLRKATIVRSLTTRLPQSIASIRRAAASMRRADTTYVNTCVIVDYLLAGWITGRSLVVHVREIPTGIAMRVIRFLLKRSGAKLIFNSLATKAAFDMPSSVEQAVVWNGFTDPGEPPVRIPFDGRALRVLCIGRINGWKGQDQLIEAVAALPLDERRRLEVRIIGGVFDDQTHFLDRLNELIAAYGLEDVVSIHPFTTDPADAYRWADVVAVPSRLPEPFGRVAIEAMAHGCAVIATAHGGLVEIVRNGETGTLVPPQAPDKLAAAIREAVTDRQSVARKGNNGRLVFLETFEQETVNHQLTNVLQSFTNIPKR
ncbi:glycosyltransferase family 4 protein [Pannonibacter phragmitetus]|uniref:glycosyltransferase family 4 protein n=1 Tax=Pannonibacter phragmitetus TaxID=121719 RepID=UPI0013DDC5AD|nr:glycosyltransferase family 4 protein [Pannonibacter phragmitetus]